VGYDSGKNIKKEAEESLDMGVVEDCVSQKLSNALSPGETPTDQDLAIKFSECREENGGEVIGDEIHKKMFGEAMMMQSATEAKNTVLGMAYNFYDRIFVDDLALADGTTYDGDFTQEALKTMEKILNDWPQQRITREFLLLKMLQTNLDPIKTNEFLKNQVKFDEDLLAKEQKPNAPDLSEIPPTSHSNQDGTTVPNRNAKNDFEPDDTLFGGEPRQEALKEGGAKEAGKFGTIHGTKLIPAGRKKPEGERIHHVAHSTINHSPEAGLELGPCEMGSILNPVTGQCDPVDFEAPQRPDVPMEQVPPQLMATEPHTVDAGRMGQQIRIPITEKKIAKEVDEGWKSEPEWLQKAHEGCGCHNDTAKAIKTLYGVDV